MGERARLNKQYRERMTAMEQASAKHHKKCQEHLLKAVRIWRKQLACGDDMHLGRLDDAWFEKAQKLGEHLKTK